MVNDCSLERLFAAIRCHPKATLQFNADSYRFALVGYLPDGQLGLVSVSRLWLPPTATDRPTYAPRGLGENRNLITVVLARLTPGMQCYARSLTTAR
jgi:hypothetical protein